MHSSYIHIIVLLSSSIQVIFANALFNESRYSALYPDISKYYVKPNICPSKYLLQNYNLSITSNNLFSTTSRE